MRRHKLDLFQGDGQMIAGTRVNRKHTKLFQLKMKTNNVAV